MVSPDRILPYRWARPHERDAEPDGMEILADPEDMHSYLQTPAEASRMTLMDSDEMDALDKRLGDEFVKLNFDTKQLTKSVNGLIERSEDISKLKEMTVAGELKKLKDEDAKFQEEVQNAFSLLMVDALQNASGFCCCLEEDDTPDPVCRWNQAGENALYFKQHGCSVLGLHDYRDSTITLGADADGEGKDRALKSMQGCGFIIQKALNMKIDSNINDTSLFGGYHQSTNPGQEFILEDKTWDAPNPPASILSHLGLEDQGVLKGKWNRVRLERPIAKAKLGYYNTSCDITELQDVLREAYRNYLPPASYATHIDRISKCSEALKVTQDLLESNEQWDPDDVEMPNNQTEIIMPKATVLSLLSTGGTEEKKVYLDFNAELSKRQSKKAAVESMIQSYVNRQYQGVLNKQVETWGKLVKGGLPAGPYQGLLDAGVAGADTQVVKEAQEEAIKRNLPKASERISQDLQSVHRETSEMRKVAEEEDAASSSSANTGGTTSSTATNTGGTIDSTAAVVPIVVPSNLNPEDRIKKEAEGAAAQFITNFVQLNDTWPSESSKHTPSPKDSNDKMEGLERNMDNVSTSSFLQIQSASMAASQEKPDEKVLEDWEHICRTVNRVIAAHARYEIMGTRDGAWKAWQGVCQYYLPQLQEGRDELDMPEATKATLNRLLGKTSGVDIKTPEVTELKEMLAKEEKQRTEVTPDNSGSSSGHPLMDAFHRTLEQQKYSVSLEIQARRPVEYSLGGQISEADTTAVLEKLKEMIKTDSSLRDALAAASKSSLASVGGKEKKQEREQSLVDVSIHEHAQALPVNVSSVGPSLSGGFLQKNLKGPHKSLEAMEELLEQDLKTTEAATAA